MTQAELDAISAALGRNVAKAVVGTPLTIAGDGAIPIDQDRTVLLTKGSAAAITVAAPGAANIGRRITVTAGSDFAHVVTFTGATLHDGTTGGHTTWTGAAFQGTSLTFEAVTAAKWNVVSMNLGAIA